MSGDSADQGIREGDTVRVRDEWALSVVVQAADGTVSCEIPAESVPNLVGVCCVPVVLVRTPFGDDDGWRDMRWVVLEDVMPVPTSDHVAVVA